MGFFGAKTNGHPRFVKHKQLASSAESTQNKEKFFVSVDIFYTPVFSKFFYLLCPLVSSIEIEGDRDLEREIKKGDFFLLEEQHENFVAAVTK